MKTTISKTELVSFAKTFSPNQAFKPYWAKPGKGHFYAFLTGFGIDGAAVKPYLTHGGYINAHVTYPPKVQIAPTARPIAAAKRTATVKAPLTMTAAQLASLLKSITLVG